MEEHALLGSKALNTEVLSIKAVKKILEKKEGDIWMPFCLV